MKISLAADHGGFELKDNIRTYLEGQGHQVTDYGVHSADSVDYPDYASKAAGDVASGRADRALLFCGSGIGMAISANKFKGVRAAVGTSPELVKLSRQHNNANAMALGGRFTAPAAAREMVDLFLETPFEGGRHEKRVEKIAALEANL